MTSLRVYLALENDAQADEVGERIGDLLLEMGFNADDDLTAAIGCVAEAPDVEAWASGAEEFVQAMSGYAWVMLPSENGKSK